MNFNKNLHPDETYRHSRTRRSKKLSSRAILFENFCQTRALYRSVEKREFSDRARNRFLSYFSLTRFAFFVFIFPLFERGGKKI